MAVSKPLMIKVVGTKATLNKEVYLYLGDGGTTLQISLMDNSGNNIVTEFEAVKASVCVLTANNKVVYDSDCVVNNNIVIFELSTEFINEIAEEGTHMLQIHLYDAMENGNRLTIPPVSLTLLKPICDITIDPSTP